ncbi:MAG: DUF1499 domain-containing protein [Cyanobacteria bacterium P01_D01_bin.36]
MRTVISTFLTIVLAVVVAFASPVYTLAASAETLAVLPGLKGAFTGERPDNLGVVDGHLAGCPASPNCVVSQGADEEHAIAPITYAGDRTTARNQLIDIIGVVPRTKIVLQSDDYILAESESRLMGFVDDTEFYLPEGENVIQVRAAARMGESDLGVNRRRIEQVRLAFADLAQRVAE